MDLLIFLYVLPVYVQQGKLQILEGPCWITNYLHKNRKQKKDFLIDFDIFLAVCTGSLAEDTVLRSC